MDPLTVVRRRLAVQRLSADPLATPTAVVRWLGAMQGQEYAEVQWSIARRMGVEVVDELIEEAFASGELVRTHLLRSRGTATLKDFTTWSGSTVADAKAGLALIVDDFVCEVDGEGTAWWSAPDAPAAPASTGAQLIPMYDELTIAYRQARVVFAQPPPRSGLLERPILVDGMTVGSWKRTLTARTVTVAATLFTEPDAAGLAAVEDEVARFGRFLGRSAELVATRAETG